MSNIMQKLVRDHDNAASLLSLLESQIEFVRKGEVANFELMRNITVYMTQYPDQVHHPIEDLIFARWLARDDSAQELVDSLVREHQDLAKKGAALVAILAHVVDGALVSREEIEDKARDYVEFLRHHMRVENEQAFPGAEQSLRPEDFTDIASTYAEHEDPIFGPVVREEYRALYALIAQDA